ncbi:MAG: TIM barrel protein, partial [Longimicrobiales bacterium]|nr:TIM barrel protein [Longimicrobiales bacterium]
MKRRDFLAAAGAATGGTFLAGSTVRPRDLRGAEAPSSTAPSAADPFRCDFAPHFGMFRHSAGDDLIDQLQFMADQGFRSLEDNGMKGRTVVEQERIATEMARLDMRMGVFVAHTIHWTEPNLAGGDPDKRAEFLAEIRESVDVARRVNATWMTVVPGHVDLRLHPDYQTAHVVESLRQASAILEPHGLVMVLEPLNPQ